MTDEADETTPVPITPRRVGPVTGYVFTDEENAEIDRRVALRKARELWFPDAMVAYDCEVIAMMLCSALRRAECTHDETRPHSQLDPRMALDAGEEIGAAQARAAWVGRLGGRADTSAIRERAQELCRVVQRFVRSQFDCAWSRHMQDVGRREHKLAVAREKRKAKRAAKVKATSLRS